MPSLSAFTTFWLVVSSLIVAIDASYVLLHQYTKDTNAIPYKFWDLYATFDKRYASQDDAFGWLQSCLNVFEITIALLAVFMDRFGCCSGSACGKKGANNTNNTKSGCILKFVIVQQMMVLYKTVIYLGLEHFEGYHYTKHNSLNDSILMVLIPSSFWITVPAYVLYDCFGRLVQKAVADNTQKAKRA